MSLRVAFLSAFAALVIAAAPVSAATAFQPPELVAANFREASLVLVDGQPHIAAVTRRAIWHFTRQSGVWMGEKITHFTGGPNRPTHGQPAIAADPVDGSLTVVFERRVPSGLTGGCEVMGLRYVTNRSGAWTEFPKKVGGDFPASNCMMDPSVAVLDGHLYVAGPVGTVPAPHPPQRIRYLTDVTGEWTIAEVSGSGAVSLLLDSHGNPQIAGQRRVQINDEESAWNVWRARGTSPTGGFVKDRIAHLVDLTGTASLALSNADRPRVAWAEADGTHYAFRSQSGWHKALVAPNLFVTDLVIDPFGVAHMSALGPGGLWYLTGPQNGGAGDFEAMAIGSTVGASDADIDVGPNGRVQVEFEDGDDVWWVRSQP